MPNLSTILFVTLSLAQLTTQYTIKSLPPNDNVEFVAIANKDQSGKYAAEWQVSDTSDRLPDNAGLKVKSIVSESNGKKTLTLHAIYTGDRPTLTEISSLELADSVELLDPNPSRERLLDFYSVEPNSTIGEEKDLLGYEHFPGIGDYKFYAEGESASTWKEAEIVCENDGAHLAIINSEAEMEVLKEMYAKHPDALDYAYLGFSDLEEEGKFVTIFGESLESTGYVKWAPGEPNNYNEDEHCGSLHRNGGLNDAPCDLKDISFYDGFPFFCERDAE